MGEFFVALSLFIVTWAIFVIVALFVVRWRLHLANQVSPRNRSNAPLTWLWSPARPARLHRRLRSDIQSLTLVAPGAQKDSRVQTESSLGIDAIHQELENQAVTIDHKVVAASHLPRAPKRIALNHLEDQAAQLEALTKRLIRLHHERNSFISEPSTAMAEDPLHEIDEKLELLESAHEEIASFERSLSLSPESMLNSPIPKSQEHAPTVSAISPQRED